MVLQQKDCGAASLFHSLKKKRNLKLHYRYLTCGWVVLYEFPFMELHSHHKSLSIRMEIYLA